ncbi:hypothetical protein CYMTET_43953 [Cymbomonas tetramitiformis]|uniref:Polymorphic outer membrane protein n=1 Tax=Cymbomonas tetramitiformis TaxID=36881 RepID=A0AAE0C2G3_9CHLO|nr:hypothetical protein CYMTET_43953 [Cymbomonas tetramitiformis]
MQGNGGAFGIDGSIFAAALIIHGSIFSNNIAEGDGGAFSFSSAGPISITGSTFSSNIASNGGAFQESGAAAVDIDNCSFVDNAAPEYSYSGKGNGGAFISNTNGDVNIVNTDFFNNTAGDDGGAFVTSSLRIFVYQSMFVGNAATGESYTSNGGVFVTKGRDVSVQISGSTFLGNSASEGEGGVFTTVYPAGVLLESSIFEDNHAEDVGVFKLDWGNSGIIVNISSCSFTGNRATTGAGGVFWKRLGADMYISDSLFANNSASRMGGVAYTGSNGHWVIRNSLFISNHARSYSGSGGVFSIDLGSVNYRADVNISASAFRGNTAAIKGGALFVLASPSALVMRIEGSAFDGNIAAGAGGALYTWQWGHIDISDTSFSGNQATLVNQPGVDLDLSYIPHSGGGGAIYADNAFAISTRNATFVANEAQGFGGAVLFTTDDEWNRNGVHAWDEARGIIHITGGSVSHNAAESRWYSFATLDLFLLSSLSLSL